ncbi:Ribonuclease H-like domain containing protein [Trema orientale]|uniref:Ribonuclease H-like domain containing protein n=1 Tax=Trema orientale TaxID=63057 RepID=A0A2P5EYY2_TREOI|nr:Ribonuclease H-like domain containing protein [Trema orientale]
MDTFTWCLNYLREFQTAQQQRASVSSTQSAPRPIKWQPPSTHGYKLNVDAAISESQRCVGFGAIIRDTTGFVLAAVAKKFHNPLKPKTAEVAALSFGINWATKVFPSFEAVETDAQAVVSALKTAHSYRSELGCFLKDVTSLLTTPPGVSVSYVPRECNNTTYGLAKLALRLDELFWMEKISFSIISAVISDCSI